MKQNQIIRMKVLSGIITEEEALGAILGKEGNKKALVVTGGSRGYIDDVFEEEYSDFDQFIQRKGEEARSNSTLSRKRQAEFNIGSRVEDSKIGKIGFVVFNDEEYEYVIPIESLSPEQISTIKDQSFDRMDELESLLGII